MAEGSRARGTFLRRFLVYGASRGTVKALEVSRGLLIAILLGPGGYGAWTLFRLAMPYCGFASCGLRRGLEYEVAQARTRPVDPQEDATALGRTAMAFTLAVFLPLAAILVVASWMVDDPTWSLGLLALALALPAQQVWHYGVYHLRSRESLRRYAGLEAAYAAVHLVFAIGGALVWGLPGALFGFVAATVCGVAMLRGSVPLRPQLSVPLLKRMLGVGFPIFLAVVPTTVLATADRWIVGAWGGTSLLGYYAFAVSVAGLGNSFAWVLRTLVFPGVYGEARERQEREAVGRHLRMTVTPFGWLFPPLLGLAAIAVGPAVELLAPEYGPAVAPARVFLFTSAALGLTSLASVGVVAAGRQKVLPGFSTAAAVATALISVLVLAEGLGLVAVAVGAVLGQVGYAAAVLWTAVRASGVGRPLGRVTKMLLPTLYCAAAVPVARLIATTGGGEPSYLLWIGGYVGALLGLTPGLLSAVREAEWFGGEAEDAVAGASIPASPPDDESGEDGALGTPSRRGREG